MPHIGPFPFPVCVRVTGSISPWLKLIATYLYTGMSGPTGRQKRVPSTEINPRFLFMSTVWDAQALTCRNESSTLSPLLYLISIRPVTDS